jgi:hypothetical protein
VKRVPLAAVIDCRAPSLVYCWYEPLSEEVALSESLRESSSPNDHSVHPYSDKYWLLSLAYDSPVMPLSVAAVRSLN